RVHRYRPSFPTRRSSDLEEVALADRPAMLDEAALHHCLADAFHPGCELTWPMRHLSLYAEPFRIRALPPGQAEPDFGETLSADADRKSTRLNSSHVKISY